MIASAAARPPSAESVVRAWSQALNTDDNERAADLSYGQKKLLEFATVVMGEPRLVLLDEPTAGVNPLLVETIERRIRELRERGLTFLVVEHNMNLVMRLCDPVIVLDHGTKLAEGDPEEVQANPRVLDAYLGA